MPSPKKSRKSDIPVKALKAQKAGVGDYARRRALRAAEEIAKRRIEALELYRPQEMQEEFHACMAKERMIKAGNRAGKSLAAFVEDARACTGRDPYNKYPKKDGVLAIVGYKESHIGKVIYPYLFKAGAFKIIRDEETGLWRVYRPWVPQDYARKAEAKPAPPLIPPRMVKKIAWKNKGLGVFDTVELNTGWKILAFSSTSKPDQGYQADLFHIDEDIINEEHYNEAKGRLLDRGGRFIWSALPHDENDAISRFVERAEMQEEEHERGGPEPTTVVISSSMMANKYLNETDKEEVIASWKSMGDDVFRKRALGELVTDSVLMYPIWRGGNHAAQHYTHRIPELDSYCGNKVIPQDWCLRLAVDPGHKVGAALYIATPPHEEWHLVFGEEYLLGCTADVMAQALSKEMNKHQMFQTFIIDAHGGNLTGIATGIAPREAYEERMAELAVKCQETGSRFVPGCSVIAYREEITRGMLAIGPTGKPRVFYDADTCPNLDREMRRFRKLKQGGLILDKGNRRANTHLVECLEYLLAYISDMTHPYIAPKQKRAKLTPGQERVRAYHRRIRERKMQQAFLGTAPVNQTTVLGPQGS